MEPRTPTLTPAEAAAELGWSMNRVYRWCERGWMANASQLPNGRWRIPASTVADLRSVPTPETAA